MTRPCLREYWCSTCCGSGSGQDRSQLQLLLWLSFQKKDHQYSVISQKRFHVCFSETFPCPFIEGVFFLLFFQIGNPTFFFYSFPRLPLFLFLTLWNAGLRAVRLECLSSLGTAVHISPEAGGVAASCCCCPRPSQPCAPPPPCFQRAPCPRRDTQWVPYRLLDRDYAHIVNVYIVLI